MAPTSFRALFLVPFLTLSMSAVACKAEVSAGSDKQLSQREFEDKVADGVKDFDGNKIEATAECEGGMTLRDDAQQNCLLHAEGQDDTTVHVIAHEKGEDFDLEYQPYVSAQRLEESIREAFSAGGTTFDALECPSELVGDVGGSVNCQGSIGESHGKVQARVDAVNGLRIEMKFNLVP